MSIGMSLEQIEAERAANSLLQAVWPEVRDAPRLPVDPIKIARSLGIDVFDHDLEQDVYAVLVKEQGQDPVILLNSKDSPNRKRFSCAHELGHFVRRSDEKLAELKQYDEYEYRDERGIISQTGDDPEERYANSFAAALLMPRSEVRRLQEMRLSPVEMALEFDVSTEAMQLRLLNLH